METRIPGGLLVAIEGIDGAGKTTLVRKCHAADGLSVESAANLAGVLGQAVA